MLDVGASAPGFTLDDQFGRPVALGDFRGAKNVLLVFFPLAFTPICEGELGEIRNHLTEYVDDDVHTLTVSVGPPATHKVWSQQRGFSFPVLSDFWPHGEVARSYGVFNAKTGFADRGTFVVDRRGMIAFAECTSPGQARDRTVWDAALAALHGRPR